MFTTVSILVLSFQNFIPKPTFISAQPNKMSGKCRANNLSVANIAGKAIR